MRYLIVKTSAFGDVVQAFPVVRYLRDRDPEAHIDWVVEAPIAPLVRAHPLVQGVIPIEAKRWKAAPLQRASWRAAGQFVRQLRSQRYDVLFDLQGNCKSALIALAARAQAKVGFGMKTAPEWLNVCATTHRFDPAPGPMRRVYLELAQQYFGDGPAAVSEQVELGLSPQEATQLAQWQLHGRWWMVCVGAAWPNKQWPRSQLQEFLQRCVEAYGPRLLLVWGSEAERQIACELQLAVAGAVVCERVSLPLLQHLMARMELVVAMDSLPLHLAGTTHTPTWSFFGPSSSEVYKPVGKQHGAWQGSCPYGVRFGKRCPRLRSCPTGACLREAPVDVVWQPFRDWYCAEVRESVYSLATLT